MSPVRVNSRFMKKKYKLTNVSKLLCKVPSALTERNDTKKIKTIEDGNSRNGYHKVKCQVPETEELQGREKGGENKSKTYQ